MNVQKEVKAIREILHITQSELAEFLNVSFETVNRWENGTYDVEFENVEKIYSFAFSKSISINAIYEQLFFEEYQNDNNKVLFHGAKEELLFPLDLEHSKRNNDFGFGFYLGESLNQAATYICRSKSHNVYSFKLNLNNLSVYKFNVDKDWMIAIAYYRGWLFKYINNEYVKSIIKNVESNDLIIAPIADNRMFDIISEFIRGEITDLQCEHALSATNLGMQYVIKNEDTIKKLELIKHMYISDFEKERNVSNRLEMSNISQDKVKIARIEYRGKGQYIDELLK